MRIAHNYGLAPETGRNEFGRNDPLRQQPADGEGSARSMFGKCSDNF
jgi:hypothetical protein